MQLLLCSVWIPPLAREASQVFKYLCEGNFHPAGEAVSKGSKTGAEGQSHEGLEMTRRNYAPPGWSKAMPCSTEVPVLQPPLGTRGHCPALRGAITPPVHRGLRRAVAQPLAALGHLSNPGSEVTATTAWAFATAAAILILHGPLCSQQMPPACNLPAARLRVSPAHRHRPRLWRLPGAISWLNNFSRASLFLSCHCSSTRKGRKPPVLIFSRIFLQVFAQADVRNIG